MSRLQLARDQIVFARRYTLGILEKTTPEEWFRQPPGGVTHIAWQVGHLAMAEYRLCLERIRGRRADDEQLISEEFLKLFGKGSEPAADPAKYPSASEIRAVFDRVHQRVLEETADVPDADLDNPVLKPHPLLQTKLQALFYCPNHEMIHAGQIALVRRFLGHGPAW
jgi:uncharacterized damage-inducible protein DinB